MSNEYDWFNVDITDSDIENLFSDEKWETEVSDAAFFAARYFSGKINETPENIVKNVINYNVIRKLQELFVSKSKPLPVEIIWNESMEFQNAIFLLENYFAQVTLLKSVGKLLKPIKLKLIINNVDIQNRVLGWYDILQNEYTSLKVTFKQKSNNEYLLTFK